MERGIGENFVGLGREVEVEKVALDKFNVGEVVFLDICAEFVGSLGVRLDSPDFASTFGEGEGDNTGASTDIENKVAFLDVGMADEKEGKARGAEEMLGEGGIAHIYYILDY